MEKKKRVRPTWTQVRELEARLKEQGAVIGKVGDMERIVRDNVAMKQAMVNFVTMLKEWRDPAILCQASEDCEFLIEKVYDEIRRRNEADCTEQKKGWKRLFKRGC